MTKAQEKLKSDIQKIDDEIIIEKVRIFIMGILAQQGIPASLQSNHVGTGNAGDDWDETGWRTIVQ